MRMKRTPSLFSPPHGHEFCLLLSSVSHRASCTPRESAVCSWPLPSTFHFCSSPFYLLHLSLPPIPSGMSRPPVSTTLHASHRTVHAHRCPMQWVRSHRTLTS